MPEANGESADRSSRFNRKEHLKKRVEISRVFKKGRVAGSSGIKLFFLANELPFNRIVITFARKYGNAVHRNRTRRLCREAYRLIKGGLKTGYDLVLLIYPGTAGISAFAETAAQLNTLFKQAKLVRQEAL